MQRWCHGNPWPAGSRCDSLRVLGFRVCRPEHEVGRFGVAAVVRYSVSEVDLQPLNLLQRLRLDDPV